MFEPTQSYITGIICKITPKTHHKYNMWTDVTLTHHRYPVWTYTTTGYHNYHVWTDTTKAHHSYKYHVSYIHNWTGVMITHVWTGTTTIHHLHTSQLLWSNCHYQSSQGTCTVYELTPHPHITGTHHSYHECTYITYTHPRYTSQVSWVNLSQHHITTSHCIEDMCELTPEFTHHGYHE